MRQVFPKLEPFYVGIPTRIPISLFMGGWICSNQKHYLIRLKHQGVRQWLVIKQKLFAF